MALKEGIKKALLSHPAVADLAYRALYSVRPSTHRNRGEGRDGSAEAVFSGYFERNFWDDSESVSGPGSSMTYTQLVRQSLPRLLRARGVRTLLDAPCGDFNWMREVVEGGDFDYIGGDIVADLVAKLNGANTDPRCSFLALDVTRDPLPAADMWMCRDCFIHLPNAMVRQALGNFYRSGIPFLLTTQYDFPRENAEISVGGFRCVNLRIAPFNLPAPQEGLFDFVYPYPPRRLALWHRDQIPLDLRTA